MSGANTVRAYRASRSNQAWTQILSRLKRRAPLFDAPGTLNGMRFSMTRSLEGGRPRSPRLGSGI